VLKHGFNIGRSLLNFYLLIYCVEGVILEEGGSSSLCVSMTCRDAQAGDKNLMPGRSADRGQTKCSSTLTRRKTLNPDWLCSLAVASK